MAVGVVLLSAALSIFLFAPVYQWAISPPLTNPPHTPPTMNVSPSYYYLGFGLVSLNICGHQSYFFTWHRGVSFSCSG